MKRTFSLAELKVESFITSTRSEHIFGGIDPNFTDDCSQTYCSEGQACNTDLCSQDERLCKSVSAPGSAGTCCPGDP